MADGDRRGYARKIENPTGIGWGKEAPSAGYYTLGESAAASAASLN